MLRFQAGRKREKKSVRIVTKSGSTFFRDARFTFAGPDQWVRPYADMRGPPFLRDKLEVPNGYDSTQKDCDRRGWRRAGGLGCTGCGAIDDEHRHRRYPRDRAAGGGVGSIRI